MQCGSYQLHRLSTTQNVAKCSKVKRLGSKGLGFDYHCWLLQMSEAKFLFHVIISDFVLYFIFIYLFLVGAR